MNGGNANGWAPWRWPSCFDTISGKAGCNTPSRPTDYLAQLGTHDFSTTQGTGRLESTDVYWPRHIYHWVQYRQIWTLHLNHILWIAIGTRSRLLVIKQPRCYGKLLSMRQSITSYLQKSFNIIWLLNKPWRPFGALDASAFTTPLSCLNPSRERFLMLKLRLIVNALKSSWHNFNFYQLQPN